MDWAQTMIRVIAVSVISTATTLSRQAILIRPARLGNRLVIAEVTILPEIMTVATIQSSI